jgi:hypothetical protein
MNSWWREPCGNARKSDRAARQPMKIEQLRRAFTAFGQVQLDGGESAGDGRQPSVAPLELYSLKRYYLRAIFSLGPKRLRWANEIRNAHGAHPGASYPRLGCHHH